MQKTHAVLTNLRLPEGHCACMLSPPDLFILWRHSCR